MATRVSLHIGAPKSGTTYLQTILWANRRRLREAGVLLPGRGPRDHVLLGAHLRNGTATPVWDRLMGEVSSWNGPALLSCEWFTLLDERQAARFVDELGADVVDVVFTARRFIASAPAAWQQTLKAGLSSRLEDFVRGMDGGGKNRGWDRWGWSTIDPVEVLPRWEAAVPHDRIHVVTVPPPGGERGELWQRFATTCGLPEGTCDLDQAVPNESVGAEAARLLQRLGPALRTAVNADNENWRVQTRWLRNYLSEDLLLRRRGRPISVAASEAKMLNERASRTVAALRTAGYDIVGDLDELLDDSAKPGAVHPDQVGDDDLLDVSLQVLPPMLGRLRREFERAERAEQRLRRLRAAESGAGAQPSEG